MNNLTKIGIITLICLLTTSLLLLWPHTKHITIEMEKEFGGEKNEDGWFVLSTTDHGCITTGYTESYGAGGRDIWVIKIDENGNEQWNKTYGGKKDDEGKIIQKTSDGGYIITGSTTSYGKGESDVWIIKIDENGNEQWNKTYGGKGWDEGLSMETTNDEGYIITGSTTSYGKGESDVWIIKIDENGNEQWNKTYGGKKDDEGRSIIKTSDGGYAIAGGTSSYGNGGEDFWIIKIDENGNEQWNKTYGTTNEEYCNQIIQTSDNGFLLTGHSINDDHTSGFIVKTNNHGVSEWQKLLEEKTQTGTSSCEEVKNGYLIIGYIGVYGENQDLLLTELDKTGKTVWTNAVGGNFTEAGVWVKKISNEQLLITGYKDKKGSGTTDLWLLKIKVN